MKNCKLLFLIFPLFLMLASCSFLPIQSDTDFYGLIIGIEQYVNVTTLNWSVDDAEDVHASLISHGWEAGELTLLIDAGATKDAILKALSNIVDQADSDDLILVYFSGHGGFIPDDDGDEADGFDEALVPVEGDASDTITLITDDELSSIFSNCRTEKGVFIIDACYSGGLINKSIAQTDMTVKCIAGLTPKGSGGSGDLTITNFPVMTACSQDEVSGEDTPSGSLNLKHGIFSYYLLDGLNSLKADRNNDNYITIRELFNYAEINTKILTLNTQHPMMRFPMDLLDILITR